MTERFCREICLLTSLFTHDRVRFSKTSVSLLIRVFPSDVPSCSICSSSYRSPIYDSLIWVYKSFDISTQYWTWLSFTVLSRLIPFIDHSSSFVLGFSMVTVVINPLLILSIQIISQIRLRARVLHYVDTILSYLIFQNTRVFMCRSYLIRPRDFHQSLIRLGWRVTSRARWFFRCRHLLSRQILVVSWAPRTKKIQSQCAVDYDWLDFWSARTLH